MRYPVPRHEIEMFKIVIKLMFYWFLKDSLLVYEEALWPKKLGIIHTRQSLTNEPQILVLS